MASFEYPPAAKIAACSGQITNRTSVVVTPLAKPPVIVSAKVLSSPLAVWLAISTALYTPLQPVTLTVSTPLPTLRSTCSGSHGLASSFSPKQKVYLAGCPTVDLSNCLGVAPPILAIINRSALPMVALARHPWPSTFAPELIFKRRRHGPLTIIIGATLPVVVCTLSRLNPGSSTPFVAATTSGKYSGKQPAITALAASFSITALPFNGGIAPREKCLSNPLAATIISTAAPVGGRTGRPSLQPRSIISLNNSAGSLETIMSESESSPFVLFIAVAPAANLLLRSNCTAIASTVDSANERNRSRAIDPTGCGTFTKGKSAMPRFCDSLSAREKNSSVTTVAVGIAALSSLTESWTLHDVHEPQSAKALITTSQRAISSGKQSASVRLILHSATSWMSPARRLSRSPTNCRNLSAF